MEDPPAAARESGERAYAYSFLGLRYSALGRFDESAAAHAKSVEHAPSPRLLYEWALAEADAGHFEKAREALRRTLERVEPMFEAWSALAYLSFRLDDVGEARRAAQRAMELRPGDPGMRELLDSIERREVAGPPSAP